MKLGIKLVKIISIDPENYKIKVKFSDKTVRTLDLGFIFDKPNNLAAEIIKGEFFSNCYIESGALAWPNGFELCPDALNMRATKKLQSLAG